MKRTCSALALTIAMITTNAAAAAEPSEAEEAITRCVRAETQIRRYIRVLQSCSDAAFSRRDIEEADALCKAADALAAGLSQVFANLVSEDKDPASATARYGCVRERVRPLGVAYVDALGWSIAYSKVRIDGTGKDTFAPLNVDVPKAP